MIQPGHPDGAFAHLTHGVHLRQKHAVIWNDVTHHIKRERLRVDLIPAHDVLDETDHLIVDDCGLQAAGQPAVDISDARQDIGAGQGGHQRIRHALIGISGIQDAGAGAQAIRITCEAEAVSQLRCCG